jgi:hypothetical protein
MVQLLTDGFLSSVLCVSCTQLNRPVWNIESLSNLDIQRSRKYSIQKLSQLSQGNQELLAAAYNIEGFFGEIQGFLQLS